MARNKIPHDDRDARIKRLEEDLWRARYDMVELMPERLRRPLEGHYHCGSRQKFYDWKRWAVDVQIGEADAKPSHEMGGYGSETRAFCPLCNGGSSSGYAQGYTVPIGLTRHLEGSHSQYQCPVFRAAEQLARDRYLDVEAGKPQVGNSREIVPPWEAPKVPAAPNTRVPAKGSGATILEFPEST